MFSAIAHYLLLFHVCSGAATSLLWNTLPNYLVMIDAGSSGSRVFLFQYTRDRNGELVRMNQLFSKDTNPGINSFTGSKLREVWPPLYELLKGARDHCPFSYRKKTPVYIFATAGMRVLSEKDQDDVLDTIFTSLVDSDIPFYVKRDHLRIIDGELEALYGWITVNVLKQRITPSLRYTSQSPVGALDLGGESTQIAYHSQGSWSPGDRVNLNRDVFCKSFLSFGAREAQFRLESFLLSSRGLQYIKEYLSDSKLDFSRSRPNPCANAGFRTAHAHYENMVLIGSGNYDMCQFVLHSLIKGDSTCTAPFHSRCSLWGMQIPYVSGPFVAMSLYFYALDSMQSFYSRFRLPVPTLSNLKVIGKDLCNMSWNDVRSRFSRVHKYTNDDTLAQRCFQVSWIIALLEVGYGFHDPDEPNQTVYTHHPVIPMMSSTTNNPLDIEEEIPHSKENAQKAGIEDTESKSEDNKEGSEKEKNVMNVSDKQDDDDDDTDDDGDMKIEPKKEKTNPLLENTGDQSVESVQRPESSEIHEANSVGKEREKHADSVSDSDNSPLKRDPANHEQLDKEGVMRSAAEGLRTGLVVHNEKSESKPDVSQNSVSQASAENENTADSDTASHVSSGSGKRIVKVDSSSKSRFTKVPKCDVDEESCNNDDSEDSNAIGDESMRGDNKIKGRQTMNSDTQESLSEKESNHLSDNGMSNESTESHVVKSTAEEEEEKKKMISNRRLASSDQGDHSIEFLKQINGENVDWSYGAAIAMGSVVLQGTWTNQLLWVVELVTITFLLIVGYFLYRIRQTSGYHKLSVL